jgi:hypothetical protein
MMLRATILFITCIAAAAPLGAQDQTPLVTRTIALRYISASDAARLVSPYSRSPQGGVFEASGVHAVTITETPAIIARMDSVIRENDRSPAVLSFRFQLIAAEDSPSADPSIEPIASTLRSLFRYKGYRLLGEGSTTAGEMESFSLTIAAGEDRFALNGDVLTVQAANPGSVRIRVHLSRVAGGSYQGKPIQTETLLTTGLTVPLTQTVILGSAAPGGADKALILAVRPEIAIPSRR